MYDPTVGRFTTQDPLLLEDDTNLYEYVDNSPTNATDPTGLAASPDATMIDAVEQVMHEMEHGKPPWGPSNLADTGEFGDEVHKRVSGKLRGKPGWYTDVYVDNATGEVLSIGNRPSGRSIKDTTQVDALYMKNGKTLKPGVILDASNLQDVYDIKNTLRGKLAGDQLDRLKKLVSRGSPTPRYVKAVHPKRRWTPSLGWHDNPRFTKYIKLFSLLGPAFAIRAMIRSAEHEDELERIDELSRDLKGLEDVDQACLIRAEVLEVLKTYFERLNPGPSEGFNILIYFKMLNVLADPCPSPAQRLQREPPKPDPYVEELIEFANTPKKYYIMPHEWFGYFKKLEMYRGRIPDEQFRRYENALYFWQSRQEKLDFRHIKHKDYMYALIWGYISKDEFERRTFLDAPSQAEIDKYKSDYRLWSSEWDRIGKQAGPEPRMPYPRGSITSPP